MARERKWARFARMLLPEMRSEEKLLRWIHDEEIDRVVAFLEVWRESEVAELEEYRDRLGHFNRYFNRHGELNDAGWKLQRRGSPHEKARLEEIEDELSYRSGRIARTTILISYAKRTVEGTLQIEEADRMYKAATEDQHQ